MERLKSVACWEGGIKNVENLVEFKDDDVDNVVLNLRRPQDIWHPASPVFLGSAEITADKYVNLPVLYQAVVGQRKRADAWTEKQPPMTYGNGM